MSLSVRLSCGLRAGLWAAALSVSVAGFAAEPAGAPAPDDNAVELFAAIDAGQVEAKLIPRDSSRARLLLKNKTKQPLSVALPATFAAVPVLAQFAPNDPFNPGFDNSPQRVGGGFPPIFGGPMNVNGPNPGGQQDPWFQPPGIFSIPAEKVGKLKLRTVCLDFGKPEPGPRIPYEIRPLDQVSTEPGLAEVCAVLGAGKVSQRVVQLAAWHLANGKSWAELAGLRQKTAFGTRPVYSRQELAAAQKLAKKAGEAAGGAGSTSDSPSAE
jgi:hypothetical protein